MGRTFQTKDTHSLISEDNICFLAEALTKEVDNVENCKVGEEGYSGCGEPFRAFRTSHTGSPVALQPSCGRQEKRGGGVPGRPELSP